jgi:hypothetical protein
MQAKKPKLHECCLHVHRGPVSSPIPPDHAVLVCCKCAVAKLEPLDQIYAEVLESSPWGSTP